MRRFIYLLVMINFLFSISGCISIEETKEEILLGTTEEIVETETEDVVEEPLK